MKCAHKKRNSQSSDSKFKTLLAKAFWKKIEDPIGKNNASQTALEAQRQIVGA